MEQTVKTIKITNGLKHAYATIGYPFVYCVNGRIHYKRCYFAKFAGKSNRLKIIGDNVDKLLQDLVSLMR